MNQLLIAVCFIVTLSVSVSLLQSNLQKSIKLELKQRHREKGEKAAMDKIFKIENSAMEEWRKGNPMKWIEIAADDVLYMDPSLSAPIVGIAAYSKYLEPLKGQIFYDKSEYVSPKVVLYGKTAVLTYNYHSLTMKPDGQFERTSFWNTTEIYRLIGNDWKIIHTHWSYIQHNLPESLEVNIPVLMKKEKPFKRSAAEIIRLETNALERWRKGDPSGFLEIYSPEITYFDESTPLRINGYGELKKKYDQLVGKVNYDVMEFINPRVQVFENTAVLYYRFLSTTLNPDGTIKWRIPWHCTEVYVKKGGEWKIVHSHWSLIKGWRKDGGV
jgi:ketosteroid isomerase-like protein